MPAILALAAVTAAGLLIVGLLAVRMVRQLRLLDVQVSRARERASRRRRHNEAGPKRPGHGGRSIDGASGALKRG